jgi:hypothetical protein
MNIGIVDVIHRTICCIETNSNRLAFKSGEGNVLNLKLIAEGRCCRKMPEILPGLSAIGGDANDEGIVAA